MAVNLSPVFGVAGQLFDNNGNPLAGGKIFTYLAGTTTNATVYTNSAGNIAHSNPIILDGAGRVPSGEIWLTDGITYKFVVQDAANNLIGTYDNLTGINSNFVAFVNQQEIVTATAGQTVFNLGISYAPGTNSLSVFVDGVNQYGPGAQYAYVETDDNTVTFVSGLHVGASVKFTTSQLNTSGAVDASQVSYDPPFVGSVATNVEAKLAQYVSVKDFGATGDGATDDTAAIQAAIDAFKSTDAYDPQKTVNIFFPMGNYRVTASLLVYSGTRLIGEGNQSKLTAATALTTQIIELKRTPATDSINFVVIENLGFYTRGTCWAIKATAATVTEVYLRNLYFDCTYCVDSSTYTQSCEYSSLYSTGPVEQVLLFAGNMNTIRNLVVEGTAGTSAEPTVQFKGHVAGNTTNNIVDRILIENSGSVNKTPLKIEDCDHLVIGGYWMEVASTNGNSAEIVDCNSIRFTNFYRGIQTGSKVSIATTKDVWFDVVDIDAQTEPLASVFTIDATSRVRISRIYCRDAEGIYPKSLIARNVVIDYVYNRTSSTVAGYQPVSQLSYQGGNIFVNPSFEAGIYGWNTSSMGAYTASYSASNVANGIMARFQWGAATVAYLYQNITIATGQIGMPITFTAWVKNVSGVGVIAPLSFGAGISATSGINYTSGTDWQIVTSTVVPQSAGTLSIGFYFEGTTDVYADEASVYFGTVARPNNAEFGSIQLTNKTVLFDSAAPTTGTWVVGSKVFNSAPAVGSPKGWICTVAGTPGTWVSEGNL